MDLLAKIPNALKQAIVNPMTWIGLLLAFVFTDAGIRALTYTACMPFSLYVWVIPVICIGLVNSLSANRKLNIIEWVTLVALCAVMPFISTFSLAEGAHWAAYFFNASGMAFGAFALILAILRVNMPLNVSTVDVNNSDYIDELDDGTKPEPVQTHKSADEDDVEVETVVSVSFGDVSENDEKDKSTQDFTDAGETPDTSDDAENEIEENDTDGEQD